MSYPPPPPPDPNQAPQLPGMIQLPLNFVQHMLKFYPMARPFLGLVGIKVPAEIDRALREYLDGGQNPQSLQNLQRMVIEGSQPGNFDVNAQDIPNSQRIGERVLTQDMARHAWDMHFKEGLSYRQIAAEFTNAGYPVAFTTIANYIDEVDDEMRAMRHDVRNKVLKALFFISLPVLGWVAAHFLW